jgi:predicted phage tail protein
MNTNKPLTGSGGGGKGGGGGGSEVKDNQFSNVIARVLTAYSSGTTGGLIAGEKSVFLNSTRLQSLSGEFNFSGVTVAESVGQGFIANSTPKPSQGTAVVPGENFIQTSSTISIQTELLAATPIIRTVSSELVNAVRIIITVPSLRVVSGSGDISGSKIELDFEVRDPGTGIWEDRGRYTITGKSTGAFQRAYRFAAPDTVTGAWDFRITRVTPDSLESRLSNGSTIQAAVELFYGTEDYTGTAVIGMEFETTDFGNSLPLISFEVSGVKVPVPDNYTCVDGIPNYSGVWSGEFKLESTSNPVWHLYNLITDPDVGLGLPDSFVDRYNFYEAARYSDAVDSSGTFVGVSDGSGGVRRRFTFNTQINGQQDGIEMLQQIASAVRGILYFGAGAVVLKQDAPRSTTRIVTNDNVDSGLFAYSSTSAKDRITVAKVGFNDPDDFFRLRYAIYPVESEWSTNADIARFGRNEIDVQKLGCASEAEAYAFAKWIVYTSVNEDRTVTFIGGPEFLLTRPGDVLEIADRRLAGAANFSQRYGGRIRSGTINTLELDYPVELAVGETYTVTIIGADGLSLETRDITTGSGTLVTNLTVSPDFTATPTTGYTWLITGTDIQPQKFSVINVERKAGLEVEIFAVKYDENKFAFVEDSPLVIPGTYTKIDVSNFSPPTNIAFQQVPQKDPIRGILNSLIVKWTASDSDLVSRYQVRYRKDNDKYTELPPTNINEVVLETVVEGTYDFIISAINPLGYESTPLTGSYDVVYGSTFEWDGTPIEIQAPLVATVTDFTTKDFNFVWERSPFNDVPGIVFNNYQVEIITGGILRRTEYVTEPAYTYYFDDQVTDQLTSEPNRLVSIRVTETDAYNNQSASDTGLGRNLPPAAPAFTLSAGLDTVVVNITPGSEVDLLGYRVFLSDTNGFTADSSTQVYAGPNPSAVITNLIPETTYFVRVQAYDLFDSTISGNQVRAQSQVTTTVGDFDVNTINYNFKDITFTKSGTTMNWTAGSVIIQSGGTVTTETTTSGSQVYSGATQYAFYNPTSTDIETGTNLNTIFTSGTGIRVIAAWDGVTIKSGIAEPIIDGANILAQTIGATQVVTSGLITNTAQINDAVITTAKIADLQVTTAKLAALAVGEANIADAAITTAKIGDLQVNTAKIGNLQVEYLKIGDNAVTESGFTVFTPAAPTTANGVQTVTFTDTFVYSHQAVIFFDIDAAPATATIQGSDTMTISVEIDGTTRFSDTYTGQTMLYAVRGLNIPENGNTANGDSFPVSITLTFNSGMDIDLARCQYTYQVYYR